MRGRTLGFAWTLAVVCGLNSGCATIGSGQPVHSDTHVGMGEQEEPSGDTVDVEQSGTALTLRSRKVCDVHETRDVSRTTTTPRENQSAWVDWTLGVGGVALAGAGVATMIDSGNVGTSDQNSRTYNPVGGTGAAVLGAGLIAIGAIGGAVALVDVFRANGSDESKTRVAVPGKELRRGVACKSPSPVPNIELVLLIPHARGELDERFALGKTSAEGTLRVDLERIISDEYYRATDAHLMRDATELKKIDLGPVKAVHEASAWNLLDKEDCAAPKRAYACTPVEEFLKKFPAGAHAAEARQLLDKARPTLKGIAERETWDEISRDACAKPTMDKLTEAEDACHALVTFADMYPESSHAAEARTTSAKGTPTVKRLRQQQEAAEKRREQQEVLAEKRREQQEAERQRQAELAEKRREQQQIENDKAALRTQCTAKCNVMCSRRVNPEMCLAGCIQLCVTQGNN